MDTLTKSVCRTGAVLMLLLPGVPQDCAAKSAFDHFTTGFRLEGAHQFAQCESCHTDGRFSGTPRQCSGCHTENGRIQATAQPRFHVTTTHRCDACHRSQTWTPAIRVDHLEVLGTCVGCHNGLEVHGKPADHLPTSDQCDDCHRTTAWIPAAFDHIGVTSACLSCHDGVAGTGKPVDHIPATNLCEDCHGTTMWSAGAGVATRESLGVLLEQSRRHDLWETSALRSRDGTERRRESTSARQ